MNILLIEDDVSLQKGMLLKLSKEGHSVVCADSVRSAREACGFDGGSELAEPFDMAIVDVNLPDGSGMDLCRELRERRGYTPRGREPGCNTPRGQAPLQILILTSNDAETDMVMGYEMGADDYMTKPFSLSVLLSKVSAVQRRIDQAPGDAHRTSQVASSTGNITFYPDKRTVEVRGRKAELTRNEWRLLCALNSRAGQTLTKESLLEALWDIDGDFVDENTLAVNIRRLREKIEEDPSHPKIIENVRGVGYRLSSKERQ